MSYIKSKYFTKGKLSEEPSLGSAQSDIDRDDDDPLSIRGLSFSLLGITFAFLTLFLPSISILIGRPFSQGDEVIINQDFQKDGS